MTPLQTELAKPAYDGLTDAQALAAMKAEAVTVYRDITVAEFEARARLSGDRARVKAYLEGVDPAAAGQDFYDLATGQTRIETIEYSDAGKRAAIDAMLDVLAGDAPLPDDNVAAYKALGTVETTRWAALGEPSELAIKRAREAG